MSYATTYDLRELADELRALLGDCTTSCVECDDGYTDETCDHCDGNGRDEQDTDVECDACEGDGVVRAECTTCRGETEIFDLNNSDGDRIVDLVGLAEELSNESFDAETRTGIEDAADAIQNIGDNYEPTLILATDFEEYAAELADDLMPSQEARALSDQWPFRHIDWEAAADELRHDYTSVSIGTDEYLIRSW